MKSVKWISGLILAGLFLCGCGQKAVSDTAKAGFWQTDYDAVLKQAKAENKYVLIDFSGSDWCGWCIKLDEEVFSQQQFIDYATANLVCLLVDFPQRTPQSEQQKQANETLARKYGIQGFPTVLILNPDGKVIQKTGYQPGGAAAYVEFIQGVIAADRK